MKSKAFMVFLILFIMVFTFLIGFNFNKFAEVDNVEVLVNGEIQTFRDSNGKILNPIEKDGVVYLPVGGLGSYLDYMTIKDDKGLSLYKVEDTNQKILEGLNTETIYGEVVTDAVFGNSDYTAVLLWGTWCDVCKSTLPDLASLNAYLEENSIQLITIVTDLPHIKVKEELTKEQVDNVKMLIGELNVDYTLLRDDVITDALLKGSVSLPKLIVLDRNRCLVKIVEENINSEQFISMFDLIVSKG